MKNKYFIQMRTQFEMKLTILTLRNQQTFLWINFKHIFVTRFITHFKLKTSITIVELRDI